MPELDADRLEVADALRRALAIENELSRPQARAYVRCLQTTWQVPAIQWAERESIRQLADARRLLHAAHIFREIEGAGSARAIDCFRRTGELPSTLPFSKQISTTSFGSRPPSGAPILI